MLEQRDYEEIARLMRGVVESEITPQLKELSDGLDETNRRLDTLSDGLDETNRRLDTLSDGLDETNRRLDTLAETENRDHEESIRRIENLGREVREQIDTVRGEMREQIDTVRGEVRVIVESEITPQLKTLAEGHELLLETLAPKSRVEELDERVSYLESTVKLHDEDLAYLKKAT